MLRTFTSRVSGFASHTNLAASTTVASPSSSTTPVTGVASSGPGAGAGPGPEPSINLLRNQLRYYAVAEIKNRPYLITKNDIIVLDRLKDVSLGDVIELNQIKELGSKDYAIKGQPYVSPEYYSIKATVIEQPKGKMVETFKKKRRKHFQRRYHIKPLHTLLRVSELEVKAQ
ncbi:hypothetical protein BX616_008418 [Lobosporangium transversale]|nr:hypothetical protein BX616_008418 [Lobosporangium transversale]